MNGMIGCYGLIGIVIFILCLGIWSRQSRKGVRSFYEKYSLVGAVAPPQNVREAIGNPNLFCLEGKVTPASGGEVPVHWWEWSTSSLQVSGNVAHSSLSCFLAISFGPGTVSGEFKKIARDQKDAKKKGWSWVKGIVTYDTEKPIRVDELADGTFVIFWQVLQRPAIMEHKMEWLRKNLSVPAKILPFPISEPKLAEPIPVAVPKRPDPLADAKVAFYKHDNYATISVNFGKAWPNLTLELNHASDKFYHEGYDEIEYETQFFDVLEPNAVFLSLNDETISDTAIRLFEEASGGRCYILRDGLSIERNESLEYCNEPFMLPLNKYTYGDFKRKFTERWPNLTIEMFDVSPYHGVLTSGYQELADDFDMSTQKASGDALHDYIFISDWGATLKQSNLGAAIKKTQRKRAGVG